MMTQSLEKNAIRLLCYTGNSKGETGYIKRRACRKKCCIFRPVRAYGSPLPEFETDEAHDYFVTRFFIHEEFYDDGGSDGGRTTPKQATNEIQGQIVDMIRLDSQISKKEIAEKLGMSIDGVKYHMKRMTELGMIRYIGTSRKGYWEILK